MNEKAAAQGFEWPGREIVVFNFGCIMCSSLFVAPYSPTVTCALKLIARSLWGLGIKAQAGSTVVRSFKKAVRGCSISASSPSGSTAPLPGSFSLRAKESTFGSHLCSSIERLLELPCDHFEASDLSKETPQDQMSVVNLKRVI